jgi:hypothetical protein
MERYGGMISTGKLLIRPKQLPANPTSSHLIANQKNWRRKLLILPYEISLSYFEGFFYMS